uniref:Uncharacterized protein n=1 Tax=Catagonus wagneri TaxID=51154 RepID=A0A8C3W2R2_9CETA
MTSRSTARPNGQPQASKICHFKLVLMGECVVGKSSLILHFVKGQFHKFQESTIGANVLLLLGSRPQRMEVPRLGVELELQLLAYATATATPDPSCVCDLYHSSQ